MSITPARARIDAGGSPFERPRARRRASSMPPAAMPRIRRGCGAGWRAEMAAASRSIAAWISVAPTVCFLATSPVCEASLRAGEEKFRKKLAVPSVLVLIEQHAAFRDLPEARPAGGGTDPLRREEGRRGRPAPPGREVPL